MINDRFYIFSTWEPRPETPQTLAQRMLQNLDALSRISPVFDEWWLTDLRVNVVQTIEEEQDDETIMQCMQDAEMRLEDVRDRFVEVVEYGVRRDDEWEPDPIGGYSIIARNCPVNEETSPSAISLNAHGGGLVDPRVGWRSAVFDTVYRPAAEIVSYPMFRSVLDTVLSTWDVRYATVHTASLREMWSKPNSPTFDLAWMIWLSRPLAEKITLPLDVVAENTNGGLLLIAAEETFDTANPKHMAAARSIKNALAGLSDELQREADRL